MMNGINTVTRCAGNPKTAYFASSVIVYGTLKAERRRAIRRCDILRWYVYNAIIKVHGKMWHRTSYDPDKERLVIVCKERTVYHDVGLFGTKM